MHENHVLSKLVQRKQHSTIHVQPHSTTHSTTHVHPHKINLKNNDLENNCNCMSQ